MDFETFICKKMARTLRTEELFDPDILRIACQQHLDTTIAGFAMGGARNLTKMKPRWYSLLENTLITRTSEEGLAAWREAVRVGQPKTRTFLEARNTGRMVVVTSAPWLDELCFLNTLPDRSYFNFIKSYRQEFHHLSEWERREFVHWMFLAGEDENRYQDISVSLLYMESFNSLFEQAMVRMAIMRQVVGKEAPIESVEKEFMKKLFLGEVPCELKASVTPTGQVSYEPCGVTELLLKNAVIVPLTFLPHNEDLVRDVLRYDIEMTHTNWKI